MALLERTRAGADAPVSPAPGVAEHGRVPLGARAYVGLLRRIDRVRAVLDSPGRVANAGLIGGVVYGGVAELLKYTVGKGNSVLPAVSDLFPSGGGDFGSKVADCVNDKTANLPPPPTDPLGNPIAQPGVPVDIFEACVDQVLSDQNGK